MKGNQNILETSHSTQPVNVGRVWKSTLQTLEHFGAFDSLSASPWLGGESSDTDPLNGKSVKTVAMKMDTWSSLFKNRWHVSISSFYSFFNYNVFFLSLIIMDNYPKWREIKHIGDIPFHSTRECRKSMEEYLTNIGAFWSFWFPECFALTWWRIKWHGPLNGKSVKTVAMKWM